MNSSQRRDAVLHPTIENACLGMEAGTIHGENVRLCLEISLGSFLMILSPGFPQPFLLGLVGAQSGEVLHGLLAICSFTFACCIPDKLFSSKQEVWPHRSFSVWNGLGVGRHCFRGRCWRVGLVILGTEGKALAYTPSLSKYSTPENTPS